MIVGIRVTCPVCEHVHHSVQIYIKDLESEFKPFVMECEECSTRMRVTDTYYDKKHPAEDEDA